MVFGDTERMNEKKKASHCWEAKKSMEPATGLEPVTPALRERCSTN